jgi:hypothetical protein
MRNSKEIIKRLNNYEENLDRVNKEAKQVIKQAIIELSWVMGEEANQKFDRYNQ